MAKFPRGMALVTVGVLGFAAGVCWQGLAPVQAEVRESPQPMAFKAGSERSLDILNEMAATLKKIDSRVERIEQTISRATAR